MDSHSTDSVQEHDRMSDSRDSQAPPSTDDLDTHQPSLLSQETEAAEEGEEFPEVEVAMPGGSTIIFVDKTSRRTAPSHRYTEGDPVNLSNPSEVQKMQLRARMRAHREKKKALQSRINELSGQSETHDFKKLRATGINELKNTLSSLQSQGSQGPGEKGSRDSTMEERDIGKEDEDDG
ncbi:hypothetical protein B9479_007574 [Cryptococcus floricola]|uniref:Uncharacterized protein n=1 Tax=Cryptococcus floricola TaxID=2591691 RepID=A0A5D3ALL2_9TREE|nr:hypothetical protein B9479_007574 [Cryptococcus floricola]